MFLYNLTLQRATGISFAIHGNFSGKFSINYLSEFNIFNITSFMLQIPFSNSNFFPKENYRKEFFLNIENIVIYIMLYSFQNSLKYLILADPQRTFGK